jgi:hypothetical protein
MSQIWELFVITKWIARMVVLLPFIARFFERYSTDARMTRISQNNPQGVSKDAGEE